MKSYEFKLSYSRSLICHALNASNVIILRATYMYVHISLARSLACKSTQSMYKILPQKNISPRQAFSPLAKSNRKIEGLKILNDQAEAAHPLNSYVALVLSHMRMLVALVRSGRGISLVGVCSHRDDVRDILNRIINSVLGSVLDRLFGSTDVGRGRRSRVCGGQCGGCCLRYRGRAGLAVTGRADGRGGGGRGGGVVARSVASIWCAGGGALVGAHTQGSSGHLWCWVDLANRVTAWEILTRRVTVLLEVSLHLAVGALHAESFEGGAGTDVLISIEWIWAGLDQRWNGTLVPTIEEIGVPAVSSRITLGQDKRVGLDLIVHLVEVEEVLHKNVREANGVRAGAWTALRIALGV